MQDKILFPDETFFSTKYFDVMQDWEVPISGFFIIAPKRKIRSVSELTDNESKDFMNILRKVREGMRTVLKIKDVYLFENEDTSHNLFHLWIFPRCAWMERFGRKIESVRPIINYAKNNLATESVIREVKDSVEKMSKFMNK